MVNLKAFRKANDLTQGQIADYFGTAKSFVSQIERGIAQFPDDRLRELLANDRGWDTSMLVADEGTSISIDNSKSIVGNNNNAFNVSAQEALISENASLKSQVEYLKEQLDRAWALIDKLTAR